MIATKPSLAAAARVGLLACIALLLPASICLGQRRAKPKPKPAPTHRNVSYGPHERNAIDLWLAESAEPTPLVLYIHGGGFCVGSIETLADILGCL